MIMPTTAWPLVHGGPAAHDGVPAAAPAAAPRWPPGGLMMAPSARPPTVGPAPGSSAAAGVPPPGLPGAPPPGPPGAPAGPPRAPPPRPPGAPPPGPPGAPAPRPPRPAGAGAPMIGLTFDPPANR